MRDRIWILAGLALFVAAVTVPFWYARTPAKDITKLPDITLPVNQKQCVAPVSYMRASHMDLLMTWRRQVVRDGERKYVAFNGKVYNKSLTGTCLGCHNKEQFCDRCHAYAGVSGPYCWNCHNPSPSRAVAASPQTMEPDAGVPHMAQSLPAHLLSQIGHGQSSSFPGSRP